jgi:P27 family predicted phage terminase small subunit
MGRRGPAPKPTALRILQGNPGKTKLNPSEPQPPAAPELLSPPAWLVKEAKEAWMRLRPDLPWLSLADVDLFAAYCSSYARWRETQDFLDENGLTYEIRGEGVKGRPGPVKCVQQYPQVAIARQSLQLMCKLAGELGLSPAARTRIQVEPEKNTADRTAERMFGS